MVTYCEGHVDGHMGHRRKHFMSFLPPLVCMTHYNTIVVHTPKKSTRSISSTDVSANREASFYSHW